MYAIVKFKGQEPVLFGLSNSGYAYRLSTMDDVEWVCAATVSSSGVISSNTSSKVRQSVLHDTAIDPFLPGDPDPLAAFRTPVVAPATESE